MKYHLNPRTGDVSLCKARVACPFGGVEAHFSTAEQGRQAYEALENEVWLVGDSAWSREKKAYEERSSRYVESLPGPELRAIEAYVNQDYQEINETLWADKLHPLAPLLDSALSRGELVGREVYRKLPAAFRGELEVGGVLNFKGYSSFTDSPAALVPLLRQEIDDKNRNLVLVLTDAKAAPVSKLSHMPQEREWLLPRDLRLTVKEVRPRLLRASVSPLGHSISSTDRYYTEVRVELHEVPHQS